MRYNSNFDNCLVPSLSDAFITWSTNGICKTVDDIHNTVWNRRCRAIEQQLKSKGLEAKVWRHDLFKVDYYVVNLNEKSSELYWTDIKNIANALDIPKVWVDFVEHNRYFVKEKELNDKYLDDNGEMVFKANFKDFWELYDTYGKSDGSKFEKILKELLGCTQVYYDWNSELMTLHYPVDKDEIFIKFEELGVDLDDTLYTCLKLKGYPVYVMTINMEDLIYNGD